MISIMDFNKRKKEDEERKGLLKICFFLGMFNMFPFTMHTYVREDFVLSCKHGMLYSK